MPPVYKFRVKFEDYDEVTRDIEIRPSQTFKDFHDSIQQSINFDSSKPASFFMSTDLWIKGQEISLDEKKAKNGNPLPIMKDSVLNKFIIDPHQKIYYVFDTWTFFIELIKIVSVDDKKAKFPRCVKVTGEAPKQYKIVHPIPGSVLDIPAEELLLDAGDDEIDSLTESVFEEETEAEIDGDSIEGAESSDEFAEEGGTEEEVI